MDSAYLQWKHVSFRKWSCFFSFFVFLHHTNLHQIWHRRWTPDRWLATKEAALKPTLEVGQDGDLREDPGRIFFFLDGWSVGIFYPGHGFLFQGFRGFSMGPDVFFLAVHGDFCKGKKATSATEMDGIFISCWMSERFQRNGSVQSPICFIVAMLFREACCFERNPWIHTVYVRYTSTRQPLVVCLAKNSPVFFTKDETFDSMAV